MRRNLTFVGLLLWSQAVWAQQNIYGNNPVSPFPYTNGNAGTSGSNIGNMFQQFYNGMSSVNNPYNMLQNQGLFQGGNYYIYPPNGNPPEQLIANGDGSYNLYPSGTGPSTASTGSNTNISNQPEKVVPNGDGSYSIYPPGVAPQTTGSTNGGASSNPMQAMMQPEKIVPAGNGNYYIYPPIPGMPPEIVIANGDGTYNIYPAGQVQTNSNGTFTPPANGGTPERVVPMASNGQGQTTPYSGQPSGPVQQPTTP